MIIRRDWILILKAIVICSLFLCCSCTATLENLVRHSSFTPEALEDGKIAVGGVVNRVQRLNSAGSAEEFLTDEENRLALELASTIQNECEGVRDLPSIHVHRTVPADLYDRSMTNYINTKTIDKELLAAIKQKAPDVRYLVFAILDGDTISHSEREEESYTKEDEEEYTTYYHIMETHRAVSMEMSVYDLKSFLGVWYGRHTRSDKTENRYSRKEYESFWKDILYGLLNPKMEYPDPPELNGITANLFVDFAGNLPKK